MRPGDFQCVPFIGKKPGTVLCAAEMLVETCRIAVALMWIRQLTIGGFPESWLKKPERDNLPEMVQLKLV